MALNTRQKRFCQWYAVLGNQSEATRRAGYSDKDHGNRLLKDPEIQAEVKRFKAEIEAKAELDREAIIKLQTDIIQADPNELVQVRRGCCRYCWGKDFFQQRTLNEWRSAMALHTQSEARRMAKAEKDGQAFEPKPFDEMGGIGFNRHREPNEECPECGGEGQAYVYIPDTRFLSPQGAALYQGAKETQHGIEVKMASKDAAFDRMDDILGLSKKKVEHSGSVDMGLAGILSELSESELDERIKRAESRKADPPVQGES